MHRHDMTRHACTQRHDIPRRDTTSQHKLRQDKTSQDKIRHDKSSQDELRQGATRHVLTRQDKKRHEKTRKYKSDSKNKHCFADKDNRGHQFSHAHSKNWRIHFAKWHYASSFCRTSQKKIPCGVTKLSKRPSFCRRRHYVAQSGKDTRENSVFSTFFCRVRQIISAISKFCPNLQNATWGEGIVYAGPG